MNVTLTKHRIRLSNSGANRKVNKELWKPMTREQKGNAAVWLMVAAGVFVAVMTVIQWWFA